MKWNWINNPKCKRGVNPRKPTIRGQQERNVLVETHLNLVWFVWHKVKFRFPYCRLEEDDAIQAGRLGLLRAAELWVEGQSTFSTYATAWVAQRIQRAAQQSTWTIYAPYYASPENKPRVRAMSDAVKDRLKAKPETPQPAWVGTTDIDELLTHLTGRRREVIRLVYVEGWDQIDVAKHMGISRQRIDQLHQQALKKLHKILHARRKIERELDSA